MLTPAPSSHSTASRFLVAAIGCALLALAGCNGAIGDPRANGGGGSGGGGGTGSGTGTGTGSGTGVVPPINGCDIQAVMAKHQCSSCHNAGAQGGLDLLSSGVAERLVDVPSKTCGGVPLIDSKDPGNSLLLTVIDPVLVKTLKCSSDMPPADSGLARLDDDERTCFAKWVDELIKAKKNPVDDCVGKDTLAPHHYVGKVKTLLTGMPATKGDLDAVKTDPKALASVIDGWIKGGQASGEFYSKLLSFFHIAFQQNRIDRETVDENFKVSTGNWGKAGTGRVRDMMVNNLSESFGRTALQIVKEGRPFTEVLTTKRFRMTTAMMTLLAFNADRDIDDKGQGTARFRTLGGIIGAQAIKWVKGQNIPLADSFNPSSPNFMRFSHPSMSDPACLTANTVTPNFNGPRAAWRTFTGTYFVNITRDTGIVNDPRACRTKMRNHQGMLTEADFKDWRWVTVRTPKAGEKTAQFFQLAQLRKSNTLVVHTPYVGFFTTPAFNATWQTNEDNQARVTINQTLIVAFGRSFDGEDNIVPASSNGLLSPDHAAPGTECWACHKTMDPMRQFIRQSFNYLGQPQNDNAVSSVSGVFAYVGVDKQGNGVYDLAKYISEHSDFPNAWVQKMCTYANSAACNEADPLFKQIVNDFVASNFDFRKMLVDLYASPLVTGAKCTPKTTADTPGVSRKLHFCTTLKTRLGLNDLCNMTFFGTDDKRTLQLGVDQSIDMVPADDYARGAARPITISEGNLFVSQAYEDICRKAATALVDVTGSAFQSSDVDGTIRTLVEKLVGLPSSDPRHGAMITILKQHFTAAKAQKVTSNGKQIAVSNRLAMQSVFVLACQAPSVTGAGF